MNRLFTTREKAEFSPTLALIAAAEGNLARTYEGGLLREYGEHIGRPVTDTSFHLPFELMARRDLTVAGASGANLVASEAPFALDVLRPYAATLRSGAQMMRFTGDGFVPKVAAPSTATWLADESSAITESQATIGQLNMAPKNAGILTEVTAQLARQTNIDRFLQRELLRSMGAALDQAILGGSGVLGQPQGIVGTSGVGAVAGASLDWTDVTDLLYTISEADAGEEITWFGTPQVRRLLARRERITGSGRSIWDDRQVAGFSAIASRVAPTDTLIVGAFSEVLVSMFQDSLEIMVNPYSDFSRGLIAYRAWLSADVAVTAPAAFAVATSVT